MRHVSVEVHVEMVSIEHGVWCDACALSSAAVAWYTVTVGGITTLQSRTVCEAGHSP